MRKVSIVLCLCLCILMFCSCSKKNQVFIDPTNFYYCNQAVKYNTSDGVISPEIRESTDLDQDVGRFMEEYLRGPVSDNLYTIIPENTKLLSAEIQEKTAYLDFSSEFGELSGIEMTTAGVCMVKSLNEFSGIEVVVMTAGGVLLDERESFTISLEDVVTMDMVTMGEK